MSSVAEALRQHADGYLAEFSKRMPIEHKRVLAAITRCRTGELGHLHYQCDGCERSHWVGRSCGNRHCPNCQSDKTQFWLAKRMAQLLPVPYFLVTFTVPDTLWKFVRAHQRVCYQGLFDTGSQTIRELAIGGNALSVPIGSVSSARCTPGDETMQSIILTYTSWFPAEASRPMAPAGRPAPPTFCCLKKLHLSSTAPSSVTRCDDAGLLKDINAVAPGPLATENWVVDVEPVGDGVAALKYLAPYVNRVAISDNRVVAVDETSVTYRFTPTGTKRSVTRKVTGQEFVRGFLQHTLPPRFQKLRLLRICQPELQVEVRLGSDACLVLSWLVLPAGKESRCRTAVKTTGSLLQVQR